MVKEKYGFTIDSSTVALSCNVINEIFIDLNNRFSVGGILCDLQTPLVVLTMEL